MSTLYLLSSPIGNLEDVSARFLRHLGETEYLLVEDVHKALTLLQGLSKRYSTLDISKKKLIPYRRENEYMKVGEVVGILDEGKNVALLTDAGVPAVSDPGSILVSSLKRSGHTIEIVPGPSALTAALAVCGFDAGVVSFIAFLPKKENDIRRLLEKVLNDALRNQLLVFFESPKRIRETVAILKKMTPESTLFLGRELTKINEELLWSKLKELDEQTLSEKGEYVGVLSYKKML